MPDADERRALGEHLMALMRLKGIVAGPGGGPVFDEPEPEPPKRTGVDLRNPVPGITPDKPNR